MIVHAVTGRRDGGMKLQAIIGHAMKKTFRSFTAPAELPRRNFQFRHTNRQIGFHDARIHSLFGDRIADDRQPVAATEHQSVRRRRFQRLELCETGIVRF